MLGAKKYSRVLIYCQDENNIMPKKGYTQTREHMEKSSTSRMGQKRGRYKNFGTKVGPYSQERKTAISEGLSKSEKFKESYKDLERRKATGLRMIGNSFGKLNKGKKQSEEHIEKRFDSRRINGWWKNPEETKKKFSLAKKGKPGHPQTKETIEKIRRKNIGKTWTEIQIENWKNARMRNGTFKHTKEWNDNHSLMMLGENNPNWRDGKSREPYSLDFNNRTKKKVKEADGYMCQLCGMTESGSIEKYGRVLSVNHINFDKKDCRLENLNTLCVSCNSKINFNRDYYTKYFQDKLKIRKI
jgi:hypothetical protein